LNASAREREILNALPAADEAFKIEWQQLGFFRPSADEGEKNP
jgi:hypothetical protein